MTQSPDDAILRRRGALQLAARGILSSPAAVAAAREDDARWPQPHAGKAPDVFISYSSADRPTVEALCLELEGLGIEAWWDSAIRAGTDFRDDIDAALAAARCAIVIWSPTAIVSRFVKDEASAACEADKLITTHIEGFDVRGVPLGFRQFQSIPVSDRHRLLVALERFGLGTR